MSEYEKWFDKAIAEILEEMLRGKNPSRYFNKKNSSLMIAGADGNIDEKDTVEMRVAAVQNIRISTKDKADIANGIITRLFMRLKKEIKRRGYRITNEVDDNWGVSIFFYFK